MAVERDQPVSISPLKEPHEPQDPGPKAERSTIRSPLGPAGYVQHHLVSDTDQAMAISALQMEAEALHGLISEFESQKSEMKGKCVANPPPPPDTHTFAISPLVNFKRKHVTPRFVKDAARPEMNAVHMPLPPPPLDTWSTARATASLWDGQPAE